jgi:hypothetical protein
MSALPLKADIQPGSQFTRAVGIGIVVEARGG